MNRDHSNPSRRSWLAGALAIGALGAAPRAGSPALEAIRAKARKAGMAGFDVSESTHFVGIGDSGERFRKDALAISEAAGTDFLKHFNDKGFQLDWPKDKLTVVVLVGPNSYAMFEGGFNDAIGGHFDLDENRLVMFDFRGPGANRNAPIPELDNTLALVHETIHQLCFNIGLLDLKADIPLCLSEGLATYGETWSPRTKSGIGAINVRRRKGLELARQAGIPWIPLAQLLAEDRAINPEITPNEDPRSRERKEKTQQLAYAESWMLAHKLLKDPARTPKFRDYLAALRQKPEGTRRVEIATEHLGDLTKLDRDVRTGR